MRGDERGQRVGAAAGLPGRKDSRTTLTGPIGPRSLAKSASLDAKRSAGAGREQEGGSGHGGELIAGVGPKSRERLNRPPRPRPWTPVSKIGLQPLELGALRDRGRACRPPLRARPPGPPRGSPPRRRAPRFRSRRARAAQGRGPRDELQPEALQSDAEKAFEPRPMDQPQKTDGPGPGQVLAALRETGVRLRPRREFAMARLARTSRNEARHMGPMGGGFRGPRLSLPPAGFRIGAAPEPRDQPARVRPRAFRRSRAQPARLREAAAQTTRGFANGSVSRVFNTSRLSEPTS